MKGRVTACIGQGLDVPEKKIARGKKATNSRKMHEAKKIQDCTGEWNQETEIETTTKGKPR